MSPNNEGVIVLLGLCYERNSRQLGLWKNAISRIVLLRKHFQTDESSIVQKFSTHGRRLIIAHKHHRHYEGHALRAPSNKVPYTANEKFVQVFLATNCRYVTWLSLIEGQFRRDVVSKFLA